MSTENPEPELEIKNLRPSSDDLIPDVHEAGATAVGGGVASGQGGVAIGGEVYGEIIVGNYKVGRDITLTYDTAFERVVGSTNFVLKQLELSYQQTREQAQGWFRFSLMAAGAGFVLIGTGVVTVIFGQLTAGLITSVSSLIPHAAAALFFAQSKAANERVDAIQTRLAEAREILTAVEIVGTIDDPKSRDRLRAEIVRKVLRSEKKSSNEVK